MQFQQLAYFVAVADARHFTRAAEELHMSQPTVSIQIRKLAETVGMPLFEQMGKRIHPTSAARELYGKGRGSLATLLLMACLGIVIRSHQLITDVALLTGFAAAFYGLALALRRPAAGGFWLGTGVVIGFMSKGLLAPGIFGIIVLLLPLLPAWRTRNHVYALSIAALALRPGCCCGRGHSMRNRRRCSTNG